MALRASPQRSWARRTRMPARAKRRPMPWTRSRPGAVLARDARRPHPGRSQRLARATDRRRRPHARLDRAPARPRTRPRPPGGRGHGDGDPRRIAAHRPAPARSAAARLAGRGRRCRHRALQPRGAQPRRRRPPPEDRPIADPQAARGHAAARPLRGPRRDVAPPGRRRHRRRCRDRRGTGQGARHRPRFRAGLPLRKAAGRPGRHAVAARRRGVPRRGRAQGWKRHRATARRAAPSVVRCRPRNCWRRSARCDDTAAPAPRPSG